MKCPCSSDLHRPPSPQMCSAIFSRVPWEPVFCCTEDDWPRSVGVGVGDPPGAGLGLEQKLLLKLDVLVMHVGCLNLLFSMLFL